MQTSSLTDNGSQLDGQSNKVTHDRKTLSRMLQLHGYSACLEALVLLEDHFTSSTKYDSMEDFINKLNRVFTFDIESGNSIIDSDLAYLAVQKLRQQQKTVVTIDGDDTDNHQQQGQQDSQVEVEAELPIELNVRIKNVEFEHVINHNKRASKTNSIDTDFITTTDDDCDQFKIHYNFLYKKLSSLPIFQGDFQLTKLSALTGSSQPNIRCICFGLLIKDLSKIDGYLLIDNTGRVPVRITPDTSYRNRLAYLNCIVLIEGVYVNPDDVLFAANIGLPPVLLDPLQDKSLICRDEKMVVIIKDLYLDEEEICNMLDVLFTGYNSMEDPPLAFILIGNFTRNRCRDLAEFKGFMKKLIRILRLCDNLKNCHFIFVPGQQDTSPEPAATNVLEPGRNLKLIKMPKPPLTSEQIPLNLLHLANFKNIHLATNPAHIYLGERLISVVSQSYIKELRKNLLHDMSDHNEELFETTKQIMLSNAHLSAGIDKTYHSSMNMWHRPDLLVLADSEATGNRYDYISPQQFDTSFTTVPSFSRQSYQFKVYYVKSGDIDDSQVSSDALESDEGEPEVQNIE